MLFDVENAILFNETAKGSMLGSLTCCKVEWCAAFLVLHPNILCTTSRHEAAASMEKRLLVDD
jgi:hypothetical protein